MVENRGIIGEEKRKIIPTEELIREAINIMEEAKKEGLTLKLIGGPAIRMHLSPEAKDLHKKLKRIEGQEFPDLDFVGIAKQRKKVRKFLEKRGWKFDSYIFFMTGGASGVRNHQVYRGRIDIDVFYDDLDMCHKVPLKDRLEIEPYTISLTDLLLSKLQIVEIGEKDFKDVIVLLKDHKIGEEDAPETINAKYIAKLFADDWCFWYTATTNLKKIKEACKVYDRLSEDDKQDVISKIDLLLKYIDEEPKTKKWMKRAKVGTKKKWYKEVRI